MMSIKKEIENFEYNKKYYLPNEHRWCYLADEDNYKKFWDDKMELHLHEPSKIQSDPEITGQKGTMI